METPLKITIEKQQIVDLKLNAFNGRTVARDFHDLMFLADSDESIKQFVVVLALIDCVLLLIFHGLSCETCVLIDIKIVIAYRA